MKMHRILGLARAHAREVGCAAFLALGLASAGCGQKGPLYLPGPPTGTLPTSPLPAATPEDPAALDTVDEAPQR